MSKSAHKTPNKVKKRKHTNKKKVTSKANEGPNLTDYFAQLKKEHPIKKVDETKNPKEKINTESTDLELILEEEVEEIEEAEETELPSSEAGSKYVIMAPKNLTASFLLDVKYDGKKKKAYVKLYNPEDGKVYRWYDNTNHLPYLLTTQSKVEVEQKLKGRSEYIGCETVEKFNLLTETPIKLTKVIADNPLAIGGKSASFRDLIDPSFEANIRYHLNYIYDRKLKPGLLYAIKDGNLIAIETEVPDEIKTAIMKIFQNQKQELKDLVVSYLPLFFAPIPNIPRCGVDIEVKSVTNKIPDPNTANEVVISIAFADTTGKTEVFLLNETNESIELESNITVRSFNNEKDLLLAAFKKISSYPIIITFNGDNFDFAYLHTRAKKLGISEDLIPFIKTRSKDVYLSYGLHIDLYRFFRQPSMRIYAFGSAYDRVTLDDLSKSLLGKEKIKHENEIWEMSLVDLCKYNARDAELTLELTQFNNNQAMEIIFMLSRIVKMPIDDFTRASVSVWIQNWVYYEHRINNYLIPRAKDISIKGGVTTEAIIKGKKYQGAIVIEPKAGVWWNVYVLDFASLYPSIIKTKNLSYETINCNHLECKSNRVPETSHWICTKRVGIFSKLVGFIRDIRVYWFKNRAKDPSVSNEERKLSKVIQSSLKVLINASYGVFGSESFALYCLPVAESTTALAREAITKTKRYCEEQLGLQVLYGDTDSIFLLNPSKKQINELLDWSLKTFQIELSIDYIFRYCGLSGRKKNYFGITTKGVPIVKGLMGKKKNTPLFVKKAFSKVLLMLAEVENPADLEKAKVKIIKIVQKAIRDVEKRNFKLEDLAISVTLSKRIKDYDSWTQPLQAALQLIIAFPDRDPPTVGSTISFVKTRPFKIQIPQGVLSDKLSGSSECSVKPIELAKKTDVDVKKIKELIKSTFVQLLDTIGISWNEIKGQKSLDKWF